MARTHTQRLLAMLSEWQEAGSSEIHFDTLTPATSDLAHTADEGETLADLIKLAKEEEQTAADVLAALEMALCAHRGDWQKGQGWEAKARAAISKAKGAR